MKDSEALGSPLPLSISLLRHTGHIQPRLPTVFEGCCGLGESTRSQQQAASFVEDVLLSLAPPRVVQWGIRHPPHAGQQDVPGWLPRRGQQRTGRQTHATPPQQANTAVPPVSVAASIRTALGAVPAQPPPTNTN